MATETVLDVKGLACPLPVLRTNRQLRGLEAGARLRVLATDPASLADMQAYCRTSGHALLSVSEKDGTFSFLIEKRVPAPAA
jgi:tRNA 2-thiouridine synthesizing protein A